MFYGSVSQLFLALRTGKLRTSLADVSGGHKLLFFRVSKNFLSDRFLI